MLTEKQKKLTKKIQKAILAKKAKDKKKPVAPKKSKGYKK